MAGNPFYKSEFWRRLRAAALRRDGGRCQAPNCERRATVVDHIQARPRGETGQTAWDVLGNLRSLCDFHDKQVKEKRDGTRKRDGKFSIPGWDADGFPVDPGHPWFQGGNAGTDGTG